MDALQPISPPASPAATPSKHPAGCNCAACTMSRGQSAGATAPRPVTASATGPAPGPRAADSVTLAGDTASAAVSSATAATSASSATAPRNAQGKPLDDRQKAQVEDLKKTDAEVRQHEQAHLSAAGGLARGGIVLTYKAGPDGKLYAVGGHVDIDTSPVRGDPTATLAKMATVQRAALAPADPSGQDRAVAAQAAQAAAKAQAELAQQHAPAAGNQAQTGDGLALMMTKAVRPGATSRAGQASHASHASQTGSGSNAGQLIDLMG